MSDDNKKDRSELAAPQGSANWQDFAEQALSAAEFLYLFWEEGFGTAEGALDKYLAVLKRYKEAGGRFVYSPNVPGQARAAQGVDDSTD